MRKTTAEFINPTTLKQIAYAVDGETVRRELTEEQIHDMQVMVSDLTVNITRRKNALDLMKTLIKSSEEIGVKENLKEIIGLNIGEKPMDSCSKEVKIILTILDRGWTEETETIYQVYDTDKKQMHIYDKDGYLLRSRPLTQEEKNNPQFPSDLPDAMGDSNFGEDEEVDNPDDTLVDTLVPEEEKAIPNDEEDPETEEEFVDQATYEATFDIEEEEDDVSFPAKNEEAF